jgi:hypothetical protein
MFCRYPAVVLAAVVAGTFGCSTQKGPPKKVCYPVKGELFVKDKPAAGALITFRPQQDNDPASWSAGFPRANVGPDGKFEVSTYGENDGAPAGDYTLGISWILPNPQNEEESLPDKLGGRYADPTTSKITAKVEPRPTELPPVRLP